MMNIGDRAPEVLGKDEQGREIRLSDYKGRKLVLNLSSGKRSSQLPHSMVSTKHSPQPSLTRLTMTG